MGYGKRKWIFPDTELPPKGENEIPGHESIIILNTGNQAADINITLFFTDRAPVRGIAFTVEGERVRCIRTNSPEDFGENTPEIGEQYAVMVESSVPVVVQYGRADPRTVAFYTTSGYACD